MTRRLSRGGWVLLWLIPLAAAALCLCVGRIWVQPQEVLSSLATHLTGGVSANRQTDIVIWSIRLPRILLALLVGAGLSCAGCAYQGLFSNPLATPDTLGVASGASFGAALGLLLNAGLLGVQALSMLFGIAAVGLTSLAGGRERNSMVLSGIMIGSLFSALVSLIKFVADTESQLPAITYFLMGSLNSAGWKSLAMGAPPILLGILVLLLLRWKMNLLPLSDDEARSSGENMPLLRGITVVCATMITASCVSMCGQVGWIGLLVPHICRMRLGNDNRVLLPACTGLGAAFLVLTDALARSAIASEIPISILTAILGAPFFIALMRRGGRWSL